MTPFQEFAAPSHAASPIGEATLRDREPYSAVSPRALLERAAELGPPRMTWASMALPDPILDEKQQPHVAARRERFTRMVKVGLVACVAVCALALGVTVVTGNPSASASEPTVASTPSHAVIPVESLGGARYAKAPAAPVAARRTPAARPKRR